jgi:hypothetical protein
MRRHPDQQMTTDNQHLPRALQLCRHNSHTQAKKVEAAAAADAQALASPTCVLARQQTCGRLLPGVAEPRAPCGDPRGSCAGACAAPRSAPPCEPPSALPLPCCCPAASQQGPAMLLLLVLPWHH